MITYEVSVYDSGNTFWRVDGKFHRLDGPAIEFADDYKVWYIDGKKHRLDGPAVIYPDGTKYWYIDDNPMTEEEFLLGTQPVKEMTLEDVNKILGFKVKIVE